MPDASWKAWERRVAKRFGGVRRGADVRGEGGGKNDIIAEGWSIECKLLSRPGFADLLAAAKQAEAAAGELEQPVAVVKRKNDRDTEALVVMRLETFEGWYL